MPREKPTYRLELEELTRYFGPRRILTVTDVANYTGRSRNWCREHLGCSYDGMTVVQLAHALTTKLYETR